MVAESAQTAEFAPAAAWESAGAEQFVDPTAESFVLVSLTAAGQTARIRFAVAGWEVALTIAEWARRLSQD
jgi:hypothetical protein